MDNEPPGEYGDYGLTHLSQLEEIFVNFRE